MVVVLAILVVVLAGVFVWVITGRVGDSSAGNLKPPDFAYASTAPKDAAKAYQAALDIPDYLSQIPCYCGCSAEGHKSNLDCFIDSRNGDDVVFDRHGAG